MPTLRSILTIFVGIFAILGGFYQFSVRPKLKVFGQGRIIESVNNKNCKTYPELQACEKLVIYEPNGHVYLACSSQESRKHWLPAVSHLNSTGKSVYDYIAVFNPSTQKITKLKLEGYKFPRGISVHGMDVVTSNERPNEVLIYLVNHRQPLDEGVDGNGVNAEDVGADSVIEVFTSPVGGKEMKFVATFKDPVISTPNDIVAVGDDMSFYFTNDHGFVKTGLARKWLLDIYFTRPWANVGYCNAVKGCKIAAEGVYGANGITKDKDGRYYVASAFSGQLYVMERQEDDSLVLTDVVNTDRSMDNLSVDKSGAIWASGTVDAVKLVYECFKHPETINCPSSALRFTLNKGQSQYYGEKYKVEKMFEDDGSIASGATTAAYDVDRKKLYLTGAISPALTVCDL